MWRASVSVGVGASVRASASPGVATNRGEASHPLQVLGPVHIHEDGEIVDLDLESLGRIRLEKKAKGDVGRCRQQRGAEPGRQQGRMTADSRAAGMDDVRTTLREPICQGGEARRA